MNVACRVELLSETVDFYSVEVKKTELIPVSEFDLVTFDHALPYVSVKGETWNVLHIAFNEFFGDSGLAGAPEATKSKLQKIINEKSVMNIYYAFQSDPLLKITGFLVPDSDEFIYFSGNPAPQKEFVFTFMECD